MADRSVGRGALVVGVVVVVAVGGGVAYAMTGKSGPRYRLATVTTATVQQTVQTSGTISTVDQASLDFPVAGEVATVPVQVGDTVRAGQTVATLDRTSLDQVVQAAQATAASARQTLANDEAAQSGSTTTTDSAYVRPLTSGGTGGGTRPGGGASGSGGSVSALQAAVTQAQHNLDAAIAAVATDVKRAAGDCTAGPISFSAVADANGTVSGTLTLGAGETATLSLGQQTVAVPAGGGSYTFTGLNPTMTYPVTIDADGAGNTAKCAADLAAAQTQQTSTDPKDGSVAYWTQQLVKAEAALTAALAKSAGGSGGATGSGNGGSGSGRGTTGTNGSTGSGRSATGSGTTRSGSGASGSGANSSGGQPRTVTAQQLAADQKAVDAADAEVTVAEQGLDQAVLASPIAGTVAAVGMSAGQQVAAGSTTAVITVLGHGQRSVTTTVGIADVDLVKRGTPATVTVDGVSKPLRGTVGYVGTLNTSGTSGSTTTYPVTVLLDPTSLPLFDGAGATVALDVGTARNVLTVPTSALHRVGMRTTVLVDSGSSVSTQLVTVGVQGADRAQITSGLKAGQEVVLAEVDAAVPSSNTQTGGFGGGRGVLRRLGG